MTRKSWKDLHLGEEALGGLSAGIVGTVIGFPLDTVKTRMQTGSVKAGSSIFKVARNVAKHEGYLSLYKGIGPPLISLSILGTLTFAQYSYFQEVYQSDPGWDWRNYVAGISCSPVAGMVSTIENLVKVRIEKKPKSRMSIVLPFLPNLSTGRHKCKWTMSPKKNSKVLFIVSVP